MKEPYNNLYLKPDVEAVPTMWGWYTWSHLIYPLTAACNIANRHLPIMESFVECPEIHINASQDPKFIGAPFMNLGIDKVQEVEALIKYTKECCSELLLLEKSIKEVSGILKRCEESCSLELLYGKLPDNLKGLIELTYDLYNNKSVSFFEKLIYNKYYSESQQAILFSHINTDRRPFVLSTPYIASVNQLILNIPFKSPVLDKIFSSRIDKKGLDFRLISQELNLTSEQSKLFRNFFSEVPCTLDKQSNYNGDQIRLRYFGHACVILQTKKTNILIDPVISYTYQNTLERFSLIDLPDIIDFVCITHNHQYHLQIETLLQIRHKVKSIIVPKNSPGELADPSIKYILEQIGFQNIIELGQFEHISHNDLVITSIPFLGEHGDLSIKSKAAYLIQANSNKCLFAVDSNNIDNTLYEHIYSLYGTIENIFIGMECQGAPMSWLYGALMQKQLSRKEDQSRRLSGSDCSKAYKLVKTLKARNAFVYAMGLEPWLSNIMGLSPNADSPQLIESDKFIHLCLQNNIYAERLYCKKEWIV